MEWQDFVGPVLVYRPQIEGQSVQHFNGMDFDIVWKFMLNVIYRHGIPDVVPSRDFKFEKLREFTEDYCLKLKESQPELNLGRQNITTGTFRIYQLITINGYVHLEY